MTPEEIVEVSLEISNQYDSMATRLFEKAKKLRLSGEIDHLEYKQIMDNYYLPLMNYSSKMLMDASVKIITNMSIHMKELEHSTLRLKEVTARIEKANEIFKAVTFILASAAAVASFATAPSPVTFSAASASIKGAIANVEAALSGD